MNDQISNADVVIGNNDEITIYGMRYAGILFRDLGFALPLGKYFAIIKRDDGVVTIYRPTQEEIEKLPVLG